MDDIKIKRIKKKDKAKKKFDITGGKTQKFIRIQEEKKENSKKKLF